LGNLTLRLLSFDGLLPEDFTYGSEKKVWWICSKKHEWKSTVKDRTRGRGCPYYSGKKPTKDNNLKVKLP